ncbi:MAG: PDZ domain-containing protein, partial [Pyrinomonadaceae bacterium]|nr:PDZ domain-containing protein [Pyrinomonadaceae bacterium]
DGKPQELTATLDEFKVGDEKDTSPGREEGDGSGPKDQGGKLGLSLEPLTPETARRLGLESGTEGVVVTDVDPSGPAAEEGVVRGDVIIEINRQAVKSAADVRTALDASGDKPVLLLIARRGQTLYLTVRPN